MPRHPTPIPPELEERIARALNRGIPVSTLHKSKRFEGVPLRAFQEIAKKRQIKHAQHGPEWPP